MIFAMGAGDRLIAAGSYDHYPPEVERLPRVGALLDPNVERILTLKPDLVVVYDTQTDLRSQLERAGIPMYLYAHRGLSDITATIRSLGTRVGVAGSANALAARIERRIDAVRARVANRPRPRALLVFGRDPGSLRNIDASGGVGFLHDMLLAAGADDVLDDQRRQSVMLSTEGILTLAPDVIIELKYSAKLSVAQIQHELEAWNELPSVPAVRTHRVYLLEGDDLVVPGPRVADAIERLSRVVQPQVW